MLVQPELYRLVGREDGWVTGSAGDRNVQRVEAQAVSLRAEVAPADVAQVPGDAAMMRMCL
jgi:hypothetical protein